MLKKKHHKKRIVNKKKQTKNKNKNKNVIKVNVNTSTSGGSGSTSIPYPIYPIAQQMFPTNTPPNVYNVFTKEPVRSNYEPETENVRETESRQFTFPRQNILVPRDDGITFTENNDGRSINFNNEAPPNLTSQLVDRRTPVRLREQIREAVGESYEDDNVDKEEQTYREFLNRKGLSNRSIGQYIRRFRENYNKK
jgi:hypothetical protein